MMIDEKEFNESQAIIDALTGGKKIRQEKIHAINLKQRKYKGIYRVQDGNKAYWCLDQFGNPELHLEEDTIIRLTPDGLRVYVPEWLPQNTVINRIRTILPEYGWTLDWNADRKLTFVKAGKKQAFLRKNGITNFWNANKAQKREFYDEHGVRLENNILIPYVTVSGKCEYEGWGVWPNRKTVPDYCEEKAEVISRWGEVLCNEHYKIYR